MAMIAEADESAIDYAFGDDDEIDLQTDEIRQKRRLIE
jgi:hypothetical protein